TSREYYGDQRYAEGRFPGSPDDENSGYRAIPGFCDARAKKADLTQGSAGYGSSIFDWQNRPMVVSTGWERPRLPHERYVARRGTRPAGDAAFWPSEAHGVRSHRARSAEPAAPAPHRRLGDRSRSSANGRRKIAAF